MAHRRNAGPFLDLLTPRNGKSMPKYKKSGLLRLQHHNIACFKRWQLHMAQYNRSKEFSETVMPSIIVGTKS